MDGAYFLFVCALAYGTARQKKEFIMFSSTNGDIGFTAIGQDELEKVNGGIDPFTTGLIIGGIVGLVAGVSYGVSKK